MTGLLSLARSQTLIVDVQERLAPAMADFADTLKNIGLLGRAAAMLGAPITISEQYPKGLGRTLPEALEPCGSNAQIFAKTSFSCAREPAIVDRVAGLDCNQAVVCGIEAHVCVLQTAIDLQLRGLEVFVVADAIASRRAESKEIALRRLSASGVTLVTTEMVIFEWLEGASAPAFKALAALLR